MEIEAVIEITQEERAKWEETRANDGIPRIANLCDRLRKRNPEKENEQWKTF